MKFIRSLTKWKISGHVWACSYAVIFVLMNLGYESSYVGTKVNDISRQLKETYYKHFKSCHNIESEQFPWRGQN